MRRTLIIALHGTRHAGGRAFAEGLRRAVARRLGDVDVKIGWVDIEPELLPETARRVGPSVIVPAFLAAGYHVAHDVRGAVASSGGSAVATAHVGPDVLAAIEDRLRAAGPVGDAVVLAAIGSSRAGAQDEVNEAARLLSRRLGVPVRAGFIYAAAPSLEEVVGRLRAEGYRDVTAATHALAPGLYQRHIRALGLRAVAEPVGVHPLLVEAIATRYLAAEAPDGRDPGAALVEVGARH